MVPRIATRVLGVFALLAVVLHPGVLTFTGYAITGAVGILAPVAGCVFLASCIVGALGIFRRAWWGFALLYAAAAASLLLGICMVPFIVSLFPAAAKGEALLAFNTAFVLAVLGTQLAVRREDRRPSRCR